MTTPATPSAPQKSGDDRNLVAVDASYAALSFEDQVRLFWEKHRGLVLAGLVAVMLGIVAKGAWEYLAEQKERETGQAFAAAGTPEKLRAFVTAHPDHPLAGVAQLQIADQAYTAGKSADATAAYTRAVALLKPGAMASRAKLGLAMSMLQAGRTAEGETELKKVVADATQPKGARAEAAYQLASLAFSQQRHEDARKFSDQVAQVDAAGPWLQRAMQLRASLPVAGAASPASSPTIKLGGGKP